MSAERLFHPTVQGRDADRLRWKMLALLSLAELFGMSLWFAGSVVFPQLAVQWALSASQTGWLTTFVQLGFVVGTAISAVFNLADVLPSKWLFATSAAIAAVANALLLAVDGYSGALVLRFLTGMFLAGVYPPAIKMISTWFKAQRGLAIGAIVGALTIGKATPYLIHALPSIGASSVLIVASAGALIAAILVAVGFREGPFAFPVRSFAWGLVTDVIGSREWRLSTGGYLGHMFELYAFWAWISTFLAASAASSLTPGASPQLISLVTFAVIAIGGAGCIWGGLFADKSGREKLVTISLVASGTCSLVVGLLFGAPLWVTATVALIWGFFVVADSAQFSALVTESVPPHAVGTALTIQTSAGFLLTMVTIQGLPLIARVVGWQWTFAVLALGPAAGIVSIRALVQSKKRMAQSATA